MTLTNDDDLARCMVLLRTHGITRDADLLQTPAPPPWYYEQQMLGFNYRMTDIQAGLGFSQLARLDVYIARRNILAERYNAALQDLPLELPTVLSGNRSAYHLYVVRLKQDMIGKTHRQIFEDLRSQGIGVNLHYMPVHLQPYYRKLGFKEGLYPEAERHGQEAITLPLYPGLTEHNQNLVVAALQEALSGE